MHPSRSHWAVGTLALLWGALAMAAPGVAATSRDRLPAHAKSTYQVASASPTLPPGARVERDLSYGQHPRQRYDVYLPAKPDGRLVVMVHGGGWRWGDKAMAAVVDRKVERWLPQGVTFVSINYRLLPEADPALQAADVAAALADVQRRAPRWGADPARVVLMGHSAGGHLVSLLAADPTRWTNIGLRRWGATVSLDSAALDVPMLMMRPHPPLYDTAFGNDPTYWQAVSPLHRLAPGAIPVLAVCSTQRGDASCGPANAFIAQARAIESLSDVLPQPLTHQQINAMLGEPGTYTRAVEAWLARVDPRWR